MNVHPAKLTLYKVAIPEENDMDNKARDAIVGLDHLRTYDKLGLVFREDPAEHKVHIVVTYPESSGKGKRMLVIPIATMDSIMWQMTMFLILNCPSCSNSPLKMG